MRKRPHQARSVQRFHGLSADVAGRYQRGLVHGGVELAPWQAPAAVGNPRYPGAVDCVPPRAGLPPWLISGVAGRRAFPPATMQELFPPTRLLPAGPISQSVPSNHHGGILRGAFCWHLPHSGVYPIACDGDVITNYARTQYHVFRAKRSQLGDHGLGRAWVGECVPQLVRRCRPCGLVSVLSVYLLPVITLYEKPRNCLLRCHAVYVPTRISHFIFLLAACRNCGTK